MISRRQLIGSVAATPWISAFSADVQSYPQRAIKIIVPLPPGSPPDVLARLIADGLSRAWKQPVMVENRPGATGMVGMQAVARSAPDGYTMGILFLTHAVLPELIGPLPYDTANDLAPVANLVWLYNVLVVPTDSPIQSLKDLTDLARAQPGALTFASGGNGSPAHLIGESFCQASKLKMLHIPFKGPAEAVSALLGNQVSAMFATTSVAAPLVRAGKLRAITVTSPQRLTALSSVSTMAESGLPDLQLREWEGLVAPRNTPQVIIDKWNQDLFLILDSPDVRSKLANLGMSVAQHNSPDDFTKLIRQELDHWGKFVKTSGLRTN
jgi:tripartite-type tricarboxylate transporter receptor subunit TctC